MCIAEHPDARKGKEYEKGGRGIGEVMDAVDYERIADGWSPG